MIYLIDTHPWIEYFLGSSIGSKLKKLLENQNYKFITLECCLAELKGYCLNNNFDFSRFLNIVKKNSLIFPILTEHWLEGAKIKHEMRKKIKNFGLIDAIIMAKQKELNCKLITGDHHFRKLKNVVYIG